MKHGSGWVDHREPRKIVSASLRLCMSYVSLCFGDQFDRVAPNILNTTGWINWIEKRATLGWLKMVDQDEWF